ncbi:hypothetical protein [Candidatus Protochlamydia phocaeensis]|uniref:hypothetical protein n=1 Tax=Candidatus Protochlamydia phocaeensis TaxID=1414722 RepID=UPI000839965B|nr:hypothetical protein [Candidatus Protochlamydia phocaeensis]
MNTNNNLSPVISIPQIVIDGLDPQLQQSSACPLKNPSAIRQNELKLTIGKKAYHKADSSQVPQISDIQKQQMIEGVSTDLEEMDDWINEEDGFDNAPEFDEAPVELNIGTFVKTPSSPIEVDTTEVEKILMPQKLSKHKRQKANRKARTALRLEQEKEKKRIEQEKLDMGFTLKSLGCDRFALVNQLNKGEEDGTGLAEDFRKLGQFRQKTMGERHVWKRLNAYLVMGRYIAEKAPYLTEYELPFHQRDQYAAVSYVTPPGYKGQKSQYSTFERVHIAMLSKIVLQKDEKLVKMVGSVTVKGKETSLHHFFNLCDIAPKMLNAIDSYAELLLREDAISLLQEVKNEECTDLEAADELARRYGYCLIELQDRISAGDTRIPRGFPLKRELRDSLLTIFKDKKEALKYIDGMLEAIIEFRKQSAPGLRELFNPTPSLY